MSKAEKAKEFLRTHYITYKREQYEYLTKADSIDFAVNFSNTENKELIEFLREVATKGNDFITIYLSGKYYGKDVIDVINELKSKKQ